MVAEIRPENYMNINEGSKKYLLDSADCWQVSKDCSHFAARAKRLVILRQAVGTPEKKAEVLG